MYVLQMTRNRHTGDAQKVDGRVCCFYFWLIGHIPGLRCCLLIGRFNTPGVSGHSHPAHQSCFFLHSCICYICYPSVPFPLSSPAFSRLACETPSSRTLRGRRLHLNSNLLELENPVLLNAPISEPANEPRRQVTADDAYADIARTPGRSSATC